MHTLQRSAVLAIGFAAALAVACTNAARSSHGPSGDDLGQPTGSGNSGQGSGDSEGCSDAAKLIYVVDWQHTFSTFDPATKTFTDIGKLACPPSAGGPFSMTVDRDAVAWVLYETGQLFRVDTSSLNCTETTWASQQSLKLFGMAFSTDTAGGSAESLYVAGGVNLMDGESSFAKLSTQGFAIAQIAMLTGWPQLTGTANADLWAWFPPNPTGTASSPRIEKIDKSSGATITTFMEPTLGGQRVRGFAFWGGDFWVFFAANSPGAGTNVYQISGADGTIKSTTNAPDRLIMGAGVSTCAPLVIL